VLRATASWRLLAHSFTFNPEHSSNFCLHNANSLSRVVDDLPELYFCIFVNFFAFLLLSRRFHCWTRFLVVFGFNVYMTAVSGRNSNSNR
jgi:hypothetical protein